LAELFSAAFGGSGGPIKKYPQIITAKISRANVKYFFIFVIFKTKFKTIFVSFIDSDHRDKKFSK
jgi:hypothetical protein